MSDFWAKRLGTQPAPAAPAPAQQPATTQPWWMPRQPVQQAPAAPQQVAPQTPVAPVQDVQQGSVAPAGEVHFGDLIRQDGYTTEKAQSAKDSEPCPDCGSPNYVAPAGHPNAMKQCFNCGWNPRFQHSTHGASGIGQKNLPTRTARAQTMSENSFNPGVIVGRVG